MADAAPNAAPDSGIVQDDEIDEVINQLEVLKANNLIVDRRGCLAKLFRTLACHFPSSPGMILAAFEGSDALKEVLLSSELMALVMAELPPQDGAVAMVCSTWHLAWGESVQQRRRLRPGPGTTATGIIEGLAMLDARRLAVSVRRSCGLYIAVYNVVRNAHMPFQQLHETPVPAALGLHVDTVSQGDGPSLAAGEHGLYVWTYQSRLLARFDVGEASLTLRHYFVSDGPTHIAQVVASGGRVLASTYRERSDDTGPVLWSGEVCELDPATLSTVGRFGLGLLCQPQDLALATDHPHALVSDNVRSAVAPGVPAFVYSCIHLFGPSGQHLHTLRDPAWNELVGLVASGDRLHMVELSSQEITAHYYVRTVVLRDGTALQVLADPKWEQAGLVHLRICSCRWGLAAGQGSRLTLLTGH